MFERFFVASRPPPNEEGRRAESHWSNLTILRQFDNKKKLLSDELLGVLLHAQHFFFQMQRQKLHCHEKTTMALFARAVPCSSEACRPSWPQYAAKIFRQGFQSNWSENFTSENNMLRKGQDCPPKLVRQSDRLEKTIKINMLVCARQGSQKNVTYCASWRRPGVLPGCTGTAPMENAEKEQVACAVLPIEISILQITRRFTEQCRSFLTNVGHSGCQKKIQR